MESCPQSGNWSYVAINWTHKVLPTAAEVDAFIQHTAECQACRKTLEHILSEKVPERSPRDKETLARGANAIDAGKAA